MTTTTNPLKSEKTVTLSIDIYNQLIDTWAGNVDFAYHDEKKNGTLKTLGSLADLD